MEHAESWPYGRDLSQRPSTRQLASESRQHTRSRPFHHAMARAQGRWLAPAHNSRLLVSPVYLLVLHAISRRSKRGLA
eukprot:8595386-Alexandrium_andersonii.AAC.1